MNVLLYLYQSTSGLIAGKFNFHPVQSLTHVHLLFYSQYRINEELLYSLIAVVDTELLKPIKNSTIQQSMDHMSGI